MQIKFSERQFPALTFYLVGLLIIPPVWLVFLPVNSAFGLFAGTAIYLAIFLFMTLRAPKIRVLSDVMTVGLAKLPLQSLGEIQVIEGKNIAAELGVELDRNAFLAFKSGLPHLVKVWISDPSDPTSYLLISSRRGHELRRAIEAN